MRVVEPEPANERQEAGAAPGVRLGLSVEGRLLALLPGRTTIGCSPRCDLRLQQPGVQPMHCLIVTSEGGATVRRWAGEAWLNGDAFDEAPLEGADRLTVAGVELEVLDLGRGGADGDYDSSSQLKNQNEVWDASSSTQPLEPLADAPGPSAAERTGSVQASVDTAIVQDRFREVREQRDGLAERFRAGENEFALQQQARGDWESFQAEWQVQRMEWQRQLESRDSSFEKLRSRVEELRSRVEELQQQVLALSCAVPSPVAPAATSRTGAELEWSSLQLMPPRPEPETEASVTAYEPAGPASAPELVNMSQNGAGTAQVDEASEPRHEQFAPRDPGQARVESFIERYADLLREDDSEPPAAPAPSLLNVEEPPRTGDDDEDAIKQYMARLLDRMRGDAPRGSGGRTSPPQQAPVEEQVYDEHVRSEPQKPASEAHAARSCEQSALCEGAEVQRQGNEGAAERLPATPPADLKALREIANATARQAIGRHTLRTHRRKLTTKVIVAMLAGMTSLWLMLQSPDWLDWEFVAACLSLLAAAYWGGSAYHTLVETFRLFDEVDEAEAPLPIDLETAKGG